jgi:hypothetical protein
MNLQHAIHRHRSISNSIPPKKLCSVQSISWHLHYAVNRPLRSLFFFFLSWAKYIPTSNLSHLDYCLPVGSYLACHSACRCCSSLLVKAEKEGKGGRKGKGDLVVGDGSMCVRTVCPVVCLHALYLAIDS